MQELLELVEATHPTRVVSVALFDGREPFVGQDQLGLAAGVIELERDGRVANIVVVPVPTVDEAFRWTDFPEGAEGRDQISIRFLQRQTKISADAQIHLGNRCLETRR